MRRSGGSLMRGVCWRSRSLRGWLRIDELRREEVVVVFDDLFRADEREAWLRYLQDTRGYALDKYEEVEPWAWRRLQQALSASRSRLKARTIQAA